MIKLNRRKVPAPVPIVQKKKEVDKDLFTWVVAYQTVFNHGLVPCNTVMEDPDAPTLVGANDPEREMIKKDLFQCLSHDAKEIVALILNGPNEIFESFFTSKYHCVSKDLIRKHLKRKGWSYKKIMAGFAEIRDFTKEIDEVE